MTFEIIKTGKFWQQLVLGALYLFVLAMPLTIAVNQIALTLALIIWLGTMIAEGKIRLRRTPLDLAFLLFILALAASLITAQDRAQAVVYSGKRVLLIPIVYLMAHNLREKPVLNRIMWQFLIALTFYSFTGIISFFLHPELRIRHIHNSMTAGGITMVGAIISLVWLLFASGRQRWLMALAFATNLIALFLTNTRGSWIGFFIAAILIITLTRPWWSLAMPVLALVFFLMIPVSVRDRTAHFFDPNYGTNALRVLWWKTGIAVYKDHFITGIGDIGTERVYAQYQPDQEKRIGHFHNNFIHIAVTLGTLGLSAFLYLTVRIFLTLGRIYKKVRKRKDLQTIVALAALAVFAAFTGNGLFEWNFGDAEIITMVWFMTGTALSFDVNDGNG